MVPKYCEYQRTGARQPVVANLPANDYYNLIGCRDGLLYLHQIGIDPNRENSEGDMGATTHTLGNAGMFNPAP